MHNPNITFAILDNKKILLIRKLFWVKKSVVKKEAKKFFPDTFGFWAFFKRPRIKFIFCQKMIDARFDGAIARLQEKSDWDICALELRDKDVIIRYTSNCHKKIDHKLIQNATNPVIIPADDSLIDYVKTTRTKNPE